MAVTRLTDVITVFESKWTYGDVKFGYEGEVNQDHDIQYPLMLIQPPESTIPVIYEGRELYSFEINFYNLYSQAAQSVVVLQKRWDNLQDLANEWLDFVLKNYQDVTVEAYLNDESVEIERVKEVANDRLVQLKLTFTMSGFTKCFRPTSNFPTDYSDLIAWLSADSLATFNIATKKLSVLGDRSGAEVSAEVSADSTKQPLRIGYDGINDKTYLSFNGTTNTLVSKYNLQLPPQTSSTTGNFTIFEVSKFGNVNETVFSYVHDIDDAEVSLGLNSTDDMVGLATWGNPADKLECKVQVATDIKNTPHISALRMIINDGGTTDYLKLFYYDASNQQTNEASASSAYKDFSKEKFHIGSMKSNSNYLSGEFNELIIYKKALSDAEIADVVGYLNLKYKIY